MLGSLLMLACVIFGLMVLFGKAEAGRYYTFLIFLIFAPILLSIGSNHILWLWHGSPFWAQIVMVALLPFLLSAVLRVLFPGAAWIHKVQDALFQTAVYAITFPFRLVWRAGQLFFERERHPQRLNAYRPVVGGGPPLVRERRERP